MKSSRRWVSILDPQNPSKVLVEGYLSNPSWKFIQSKIVSKGRDHVLEQVQNFLPDYSIPLKEDGQRESGICFSIPQEINNNSRIHYKVFRKYPYFIGKEKFSIGDQAYDLSLFKTNDVKVASWFLINKAFLSRKHLVDHSFKVWKKEVESFFL